QAPPTSAPWAGGTPPAPPPPQTASGTWTAPPAPLSGPEEDASTSSPADAVSALKTATLAARGAHLAYLHFSERELATGASDEAGGYSDEYVSAWLTLTDAVAAFRSAHAAAVAAAAGSGRTLEEACAGQPDLLHVLQTLEPYLAAESDDQVHEAFLTVARSELPDS
ncbi:MAG: hypothetical protein GX624_09130, partial [Actinobacteria bacterium]|nr:hypothetical protein [Actinomycetota bacterium]